MPDDIPSARVISQPSLGPDNYRIRRVIARGGMGSILEAEDAKLQRTVAAKVMLTEADADETLCQRFVHEGQVLAQLAHPNIVPIHDIVWENGLPLFYTMKLVQGRTLQSILDDLRAQDPVALRDYCIERLLVIFRKVCDAVAFAHSKGVLHRDLKPENVMVGEFGEVLVVDWGLAKTLSEPTFAEASQPRPKTTEPPQPNSGYRVQSTDNNTAHGSLMGTPQYMAPEQAEGMMDDMDARSDVFSLGGVLYSILTLKPPVEGDSLHDILQKVIHAQITPPTSLIFQSLPHLSTGRVPAALSAVVMKAMQRKKTDRYPDVAELGADVEAYQNGFATSAEQASLGRQLLLLIKRNKAVFGTAAIATLLILVLAIWFVINLRISEQHAVTEAARASKAERAAIQEKELTRQALAHSSLALAESELREDNGPAMQAALETVPPDLRNDVWSYLKKEADTSTTTISTGRHRIESVAAHPKLPNVFAVVDRRQKIYLVNVKTKKHLLEIKTSEEDQPLQRSHLAFSTDGERLAFAREIGRGITIYDTRKGSILAQWDAPPARKLQFSPDGLWLLHVKNVPEGAEDSEPATQACLWDTLQGTCRWRSGSAENAFILPNGNQALLHGPGEGVRLVDISDGKVIHKITSYLPGVIAIHPAGRMAVLYERSGRVRGFALPEGELMFQFKTPRTIQRVVFTPLGGNFVTLSTLVDGRQEIQTWNSANGGRLEGLRGGSGLAEGMSIHPLSGELFVSGSTSRVWNLEVMGPKWMMKGTGYGNAGAAFWGADDVLFSPMAGGSGRTALIQLRPGVPNATLWLPPAPGYQVPLAHVAGSYAIVGGRFTREPILLLKKSGLQVEQVASFTPTSVVAGLHLSPTGHRVAVLSEASSELPVYDPITGQAPVRMERQNLRQYNNVAWLSPRQLLGLATAHQLRGNEGSEERLAVWDVDTGVMLRTVANATQMDALAVAPDTRTFAEAGVDACVRIRDATTLHIIHEFRAHNGPITALAWHPHKPLLATACTDLSIRLWDTGTGRRIADLRGPTAIPSSLVFSPSGQRLACGSLDQATRIWSMKDVLPLTAPEQGQSN